MRYNLLKIYTVGIIFDYIAIGNFLALRKKNRVTKVKNQRCIELASIYMNMYARI